ncbi:hect [Ophiocordyceps camponoti-floridani]|uniref:HECT-type E3 ubiquitin transferase n=1 Tax=Ophiocordyceps camponoti-floridani TaxID=2030778 RepID=A0A8H4VB91_9HYPO|nr:hect [Ophiocordyceps camponoti-floridani]
MTSSTPSQRDLVTRIHNSALLTPTALPGRLQIANPEAQAISTSSESEFEHRPPRPGNIPHRHSRSMSNPFPSLFHSKKKRQDSTAPLPPSCLELECEGGAAPAQSLRRQKRGGPFGSKEFINGNCMTCASLVKWPKELNTFKCTICSTVNDLIPAPKPGPPQKESHWGRPSSRRRDEAQEPAASLGAHPISFQLTKRLVKQSLCSYVLRRLCIKTRSNSDTPSNTSPQTPCSDQQRPAAKGQGYAKLSADRDGSMITPAASETRFVFDEELTIKPKDSRSHSASFPGGLSLLPPRTGASPGSRLREPSATRKDEVRRVFKPLTDYVASSFSSFACVNSSFMTCPRQPTRTGSDYLIKRKPVPIRELQKRQASEPTRQNHVVSELDPKMLLLGDFAENGTWWAGGQQQATMTASPYRPEGPGTVSASSKSPHVNWQEVSDWYSMVINAAEGWRDVFEELSRDPDFIRPSEDHLRACERELLEAQVHVQRVLLKVTEMLLKRPGRPLTAPVNLRFLLIILENPLLRADVQTFEGFLQVDGDAAFPRRGSLAGLSASSRRGLSSGHHSGIIKRVVGLLSNSSSECHNYLISWFAKYPAGRFVRVKDLLAGFLTYRLLREGDKTRPAQVDITAGLIPEMQAGRSVAAYLHDEIHSGLLSKKQKGQDKNADDWQIKAVARVLALLFAANNLPKARQGEDALANTSEAQAAAVRESVHASGQLLPTSDFYSLVLDNIDLVADFEAWESKRSKFCFCQYPFLLSIWAKTKILEYDTRRQMQNKARDAFFDSIMTRRNIKQYLSLDVRRDCLVDDSLKAVSEVIGSGSGDVKKALRITFRGEEGIDGGGLRKEWFLLLVREVFNPDHGLFLYDDDSRYCYFNPNSFETSDQFFLVGVVMGLAIYNSTILDVALPPFAFRKLLAAAPAHGQGPSSHPRPSMKYSLDDLAEYKPRVARSLRQLLEYDGDVEQVFALDFVYDMERYGTSMPVPLCLGGERKPVTSSNRREYVELYVRYALETAVARQFEPFKRGFYTVCGGHAFSLFRPEEIELLVRGSDETLDISALRAVAEYDNWGSDKPDETEPVVGWFWETFQSAAPADQRKMLLFITGSDRLPAMGAAMLTIKISCLGEDCGRFPIARTCFNMLSLWKYESKQRLEGMLWRAVRESEGFGLK